MLTVHSLLRPLPVFLGAAVVLRAFANRATLVTAVSGATASDVGRASGRSVIPIANGIELRDWSTAPHVSSGVRLVAVTRLVAKKRPIDLIHAMAFATSRDPSRAATLDIAGDGAERTSLERLAVRFGINDRITFHGECSRARVRDLVKAASLFVHAGVHEAFGLAVLEARASGVPIVAMASGGIPELVEHGRHGLLARDRAGFCDAVAAMMGDAALRQRCGQEAGRGLEAYDWSRIVPQHEAAYVRAIEANYTSGRQVKKQNRRSDLTDGKRHDQPSPPGRPYERQPYEQREQHGCETADRQQAVASHRKQKGQRNPDPGRYADATNNASD